MCLHRLSLASETWEDTLYTYYIGDLSDIEFLGVIKSMYRYYWKATINYVYLEDVSAASLRDASTSV